MKYIFLFLFLTVNAQAEVLLKDIGIIGLMSHDIFAWDRKNEVNTENGRLDLSTIFDYDEGARWKKGGNPKNGENAPVYTVTMDLVKFYKKALKTHSSEEARRMTVVYFQDMIKESFERLSGMDFPAVGLRGKVTNTEQAALRGMHDILPGKARLDRQMMKEFKLTNPLFAKLKLNKEEMDQVVPYFDGDYDYEYQNIKIPFTKVKVDLKKVDREFIEKFSPYTQEYMLSELGKVGRGEMHISEVFFVHHLFELVSKAICPEGNPWMPQNVVCIDN